MSLRHIQETLDRLDGLYLSQINAFDQELLPDLEAHMADRKRVFDHLKELVEATLPDMQDADVLDNLPQMEGLVRHLHTIRHQNNTLKSRVAAAKDGLKQSMSRLSAGRRAMNAYGSPQSVRCRPRVLTVRN